MLSGYLRASYPVRPSGRAEYASPSDSQSSLKGNRLESSKQPEPILARGSVSRKESKRKKERGAGSTARPPKATQPVQEPRDGRPRTPQPALPSDGALVLLEAANDVVDDALPRASQVVVGQGRTLAVAAGPDGLGASAALE